MALLAIATVLVSCGDDESSEPASESPDPASETPGGAVATSYLEQAPAAPPELVKALGVFSLDLSRAVVADRTEKSIFVAAPSKEGGWCLVVADAEKPGLKASSGCASDAELRNDGISFSVSAPKEDAPATVAGIAVDDVRELRVDDVAHRVTHNVFSLEVPIDEPSAITVVRADGSEHDVSVPPLIGPDDDQTTTVTEETRTGG